MVIQLKKWIVVFIIIWSNIVFASDVKVSVSQDPILLNESFTLSFKVDGKITQMPDFSPLEKDFQIISRLEQSDMSIVNGNMEQSVVFQLELLPRKLGTIRLPSIQFGDELSSARLLTVVDSATARSSKQQTVTSSAKEVHANGEPIIVEASLSKSKAYLLEQTVITIKLYYNIPILSGTLSDPIFKDGEAFVQKLGEDKNYSTTLKGRPFEVVERHYALYPQKTGKLKIEPIVFEGQVSHQLQSFFGNMPGAGTTKRIRSKSLEIDVAKPLFEPWLPASKLELTESWSDNEVENKGDPLTRVIKIRAVGQPASGIPNLKIKYPDGIRAYPDRANKNDLTTFQGITGVKEEKIVLMPTKNGTIILPEVQIKWFDTTEQKTKIASLPARTIQVTKAGSQPSNENNNPVEKAEGQKVPAESEFSGQSPNNSNQSTSTNPEKNLDGVSNSQHMYLEANAYVEYLGWIVSILIALIAMLYTKYQVRTLSAKKHHAQMGYDAHQPAASDNLYTIESKLKEACLGNQSKLAERFLIEYCKIKFQNHSLTTLISLSHYFDVEMQNEIALLNQSRYSKLSQPWQGSGLWSTLKRQQFSKKILNHETDIIKPLYPRSKDI